MEHTWSHVVEGAAIHLLGRNQVCSCKARHVCQSCQGQDNVNAKLLAALEQGRWLKRLVDRIELDSYHIELSEVFKGARAALAQGKKE